MLIRIVAGECFCSWLWACKYCSIVFIKERLEPFQTWLDPPSSHVYLISTSEFMLTLTLLELLLLTEQNKLLMQCVPEPSFLLWGTGTQTTIMYPNIRGGGGVVPKWLASSHKPQYHYPMGAPRGVSRISAFPSRQCCMSKATMVTVTVSYKRSARILVWRPLPWLS